MQTLPREYYRLLHELQSVDFVLLELSLYLDTHPDDPKAIGQFSQFYRRKAVLMQQYESSYGSLLEYGNRPIGNRWSWAESPWPWQV